MKTAKFEIEIDYQPKKISETELIKQTVYTLAVYLEGYCEYVGAPKIVRVIGKKDNRTIHEETPERATAW